MRAAGSALAGALAARDGKAGGLDPVGDAVELVAPVGVRVPHRGQVVEAGQVAEPAVRRLGHLHLAGEEAAVTLGGIDPEALGGLAAQEARLLARGHRGQEEARSEADGARRRRDEVREIAEGREVQVPALLLEQRVKRRALGGERVPYPLHPIADHRVARIHRPAVDVAADQEPGLFHQLARRGHPEGEWRQAVGGGERGERGRGRDAAAASQRRLAGVGRLDLAAGERVEPAEEAHALLPADHVHLDRAARPRADQEDGGGGTRGGRRAGGRGHAGGTRERVSPASCSSRASADTGLAITRSTNCMDSCAETPSPQPVRMNTAVPGERALMRWATSQPFILGMPRSVITTSWAPGSKTASASSPLAAVVTACPSLSSTSESTLRSRGSSSTRSTRAAWSGETWRSARPSEAGMIWKRLACRRRRTVVPLPTSLSMATLPPWRSTMS